MKAKTIKLICEIVRLIAAAIAGALAGREEVVSDIADVVSNLGN